MTSIHHRLWVSAAWVCLLTAPAHAEAYMEVTATPQEVVLGETFSLRISVVQSSENLNQNFAVPRLTLPSLPDVEVVNYQNQNYRVQLGGRQKMNTEAVYILRPKKAGNIEIPALEQPYQEGTVATVLRSEALTIKVQPSNSGFTPFSQVSPTPSSEAPGAPFLPPPSTPLLPEEPEGPSFLQRALQGLFLLGILLAGMGLGWVLRRRSKERGAANDAGAHAGFKAGNDLSSLPLPRFFPLSHKDLQEQSPEAALNTFRLELTQNLVSRGLLSTTAEAHALSNQEILNALQKQLVPLPFYEACQGLLKQDEAIRYQGTVISMAAVRALLQEGERVFQKS